MYILYNTNAILPQLNWVGFCIDNIISSLIIFSVVRSQPTGTIALGQSIVYDKILLNVGSGWQTSASPFVAPLSGNYYLAFRDGVDARSSHFCCIYSPEFCNYTMDFTNTGPVFSDPIVLQISFTNCITKNFIYIYIYIYIKFFYLFIGK
jgi:hypothetical protein